ncbi:c-type heme family protein [Calothrix rhizosoleniae]|uniref:c-type heme family protein n=1 Tax=Calothrix rhizosoleniae TaxID=888997 RepID=UPI000B4A2F0D|nr:DUF3365 domain-containing protein [Calothrix rhizosoleniae]
MLKNLNLKQKFTIVLLLILVFALSLSGWVLSSILIKNAEEEIAAKTLTLMDTISSVRVYSVAQVTPELSEKLKTKFLPQSVSAYAAREVFDILRKQPQYSDYFYKEAALNPTNIRDKADNFETEIIEKFRRNEGLKQMSGFRSLTGEDLFYIARPLVVSQPGCLECHSTFDVAPKTMIDIYGKNNGFGWKLNEIIGAQVISIPANKVINQARQSAVFILLIVFIVFIAIIILINLFLTKQIVSPLKRLTRIAEEVSTGHLDLEFAPPSNDEIGNLAKAFKRMQRSLAIAMKKLKNNPDNQ